MKIEEIRARVEKATAGPWKADEVGVGEWFLVVPEPDGDGWKRRLGEIDETADADFIAHAREDITYLLARVEALEKVIKAHGVKMGVIQNEGVEVLVVEAPKEPGDTICLKCYRLARIVEAARNHSCAMGTTQLAAALAGEGEGK